VCQIIRTRVCQLISKTTVLVLAPVPPESRAGEPLALTPAQAQLRKMVLDAVPSPHSQRNYAKALDALFAFCASRPLSRSLLVEWRAGMESLSPSTINVRLSAVRKLVREARRAGMIGQEEAASLTDIPNISQKGTRLGNWLTREQAKELLADLEGKGRRIRTVAIPIWVKQGIDAWRTAAGIDKGRLLRSISKSGKLNRDSLSDWAVWSVVEQSSKQIGIEHFGAHDLRRTCAKLCRKNGGDLEQIKFLLGHSSIQTTERYLGSEQDIEIAVNDNLGL
jgi:integrase